MGNVLLAISVFLIVTGAFTLSSTVLDPRYTLNLRTGRVIRGASTEALGAIFFVLALIAGVKLHLALLMIPIGLSLGIMVGLASGLIIPKMQLEHDRKMAQQKDLDGKA